MLHKTVVPAVQRGYVLKPSSNHNVIYDSGSAPEEPGDIVVDCSLRAAYAIWKDGSRRRLTPGQTVAIVAEVRRRVQTQLSVPVEAL